MKMIAILLVGALTLTDFTGYNVAYGAGDDSPDAGSLDGGDEGRTNCTSCEVYTSGVVVPFNLEDSSGPGTVLDRSTLDIQPVKAGQVVPADGVWVDAPSFVAMAQRTASAEAERDALRANPPQPVWGLPAVLLCVAAGVGGVALGWALRTALPSH